MKFFDKIFKKKEEKDNSFGKFIKELRKENGLSQYELADMIPISREAVSKWERNTTKPNKDSLARLSQIFNISSDELLIGKRFKNIEKEELAKITVRLYEAKKKIIKLLIISVTLIFILLFSFLAYYFVTSYNSIKVYRFNYNTEELTLQNGIFVTTRKKLYFSIGDILTDKEITGLRLYYKIQNEEIDISSNEKDVLFLYDNYGYDKFFKYEDLDQVLDNMYLEILYEEDNPETIKLDFKEDFTNSLFSKELKEELFKNDKNSNSEFEFSEEIIKRKYNSENGFYNYTNNNINSNYIEAARILDISIDENDYRKEWYYNFISNNLEYHEYYNSQEIKYFSYSEDKNLCNDECQEVMNTFYDLMKDILS